MTSSSVPFEDSELEEYDTWVVTVKQRRSTRFSDYPAYFPLDVNTDGAFDAFARCARLFLHSVTKEGISPIDPVNAMILEYLAYAIKRLRTPAMIQMRFHIQPDDSPSDVDVTPQRRRSILQNQRQSYTALYSGYGNMELRHSELFRRPVDDTIDDETKEGSGCASCFGGGDVESVKKKPLQARNTRRPIVPDNEHLNQFLIGFLDDLLAKLDDASAKSLFQCHSFLRSQSALYTLKCVDVDYENITSSAGPNDVTVAFHLFMLQTLFECNAIDKNALDNSMKSMSSISLASSSAHGFVSSFPDLNNIMLSSKHAKPVQRFTQRQWLSGIQKHCSYRLPTHIRYHISLPWILEFIIEHYPRNFPLDIEMRRFEPWIGETIMGSAVFDLMFSRLMIQIDNYRHTPAAVRWLTNDRELSCKMTHLSLKINPIMRVSYQSIRIDLSMLRALQSVKMHLPTFVAHKPTLRKTGQGVTRTSSRRISLSESVTFDTIAQNLKTQPFDVAPVYRPDFTRSDSINHYEDPIYLIVGSGVQRIELTFTDRNFDRLVSVQWKRYNEGDEVTSQCEHILLRYSKILLDPENLVHATELLCNIMSHARWLFRARSSIFGTRTMREFRIVLEPNTAFVERATFFNQCMSDILQPQGMLSASVPHSEDYRRLVELCRGMYEDMIESLRQQFPVQTRFVVQYNNEEVVALMGRRPSMSVWGWTSGLHTNSTMSG